MTAEHRNASTLIPGLEGVEEEDRAFLAGLVRRASMPPANGSSTSPPRASGTASWPPERLTCRWGSTGP